MRRDNKGRDMNGWRTARHATRAAALAVVLGAAGVTGCSEQIIKHGHQFRETDIQSIQPGMSQEQVKTTLGTPATTAVVGGGDRRHVGATCAGLLAAAALRAQRALK